MPRNPPRYVCPQKRDSDSWDAPSYLKHPANPDSNNIFYPADTRDRNVEIHWGFDREYESSEDLVAKWVDKIQIPEGGRQTFYVDKYFCLLQLGTLAKGDSTGELKS